MKFALPQEVSNHVRYKVCKFYGINQIIGSPSTSSKLITATDSIALVNDKVGHNLELIEGNLTDILSPTTSSAFSNEFGMITTTTTTTTTTSHDEQVAVEMLFTCKTCSFR